MSNRLEVDFQYAARPRTRVPAIVSSDLRQIRLSYIVPLEAMLDFEGVKASCYRHYDRKPVQIRHSQRLQNSPSREDR